MAEERTPIYDKVRVSIDGLEGFDRRMRQIKEVIPLAQIAGSWGIEVCSFIEDDKAGKKSRVYYLFVDSSTRDGQHREMYPPQVVDAIIAMRDQLGKAAVKRSSRATGKALAKTRQDRIAELERVLSGGSRGLPADIEEIQKELAHLRDPFKGKRGKRKGRRKA